MANVKMDQLLGKVVISKDGRKLGTIGGLGIDSDSWHVNTLSVRLEREMSKELGHERKVFGFQTVDLSTQRVAAVGDTVVLNATIAELEEVRRAAPPPEEAEPQPA